MIIRLKRVVLVAVVATVSVGLSLSASAAAAPQITSAVNIVSLRQAWFASQVSQAFLDQQLTSISNAGITMTRSDAPFNLIEPQSGVFKWAPWDAWVTDLAEHGLTWQPMLGYCATWAAIGGACNPSDYASFAQAVAARYGANGSFWTDPANSQVPYHPVQIFEIWNEENSSSPPESVTAPQYAQMYYLAHQDIHTSDPTASVIVGGLGDGNPPCIVTNDGPAQYVAQMLASQPALVGNIDGFGLHPYAHGGTADVSKCWVKDFESQLTTDQEGGVPIDITEVGWPELTIPPNPPNTPNLQPWVGTQFSALGQAFGNSNCPLRELAPFEWIAPEATSGSTGDFGFVDPTGTTYRPAEQDWLSGLTQAAAGPVQTVC